LCFARLPRFLITSSSVIFHRLRQNPTLHISYFVFNHATKNETAENVIRFLLKQALAQLPRCPDNVYDEYRRYKKDPHKVALDQSKLETLFKSSFNELSKAASSQICILLDAYDEFRHIDGDEGEGSANREERERADLRNCLSEVSRLNSAKIFITTRPHCFSELESSFADAQMVEYKGSRTDVERYLDDELSNVHKLAPTIKNLIRSTILEKNQEAL
jgi:NACHT domain